MESLYKWTNVPDDVHERVIPPMTQEEHKALFFSWYRPDLLGHVDLDSDSETDEEIVEIVQEEAPRRRSRMRFFSPFMRRVRSLFRSRRARSDRINQ